jgi:transcriptional regulator with XRE-family HTH domain
MLALRELICSDTTVLVPDSLWTIGDVVRKLRDGKGWTQADLAREASLDITAVNRLEKRSEKSEQRTIYRVANALGISVADLYAHAEPASLSSEQREWLALLTKLAPERKALVLQVAQREMAAQTAQTTAPGSVVIGDQAKTGT